MELYTSYWQNPGLAGLDVISVGISRGVPRGTLAKRLPYRYKSLEYPFELRILALFLGTSVNTGIGEGRGCWMPRPYAAINSRSHDLW
jgi:hypothetical protein